MRDQGFALIGAIIIMVIFAAAGVFMTSIFSTDLEVALDTLRSAQAFYIAEAGVQRVLCILKNDADFRIEPYTVTGDIGGGGFSVAVAREASTYTMTSTGTVGVVKRRIKQTVTATGPAFNYALFLEDGNQPLVFDDNVQVSGDVYYENSDVVVTTNASIVDGLVYANSVSGDGTYEAAPAPPDPVPVFPAFDSTWYDAQIATAQIEATGQLILTGSTAYYLNGATQYYTKVTVQDNAVLYGPGTIVATNDIIIKNYGLVTEDVALLTDKKLEMSNYAKIEEGGLLYTERECVLQDDAVLEIGNILIPNQGTKMELSGSASLQGALFCNRLALTGSASITGSVIAKTVDNDAIGDDVTITYSEEVLANLPRGLEGSEGIGSVLKLQNDWDEVAPADQ